MSTCIINKTVPIERISDNIQVKPRITKFKHAMEMGKWVKIYKKHSSFRIVRKTMKDKEDEAMKEMNE